MLGNGHHHKPWPGQEPSASYSSFIICSRDGSFPSACQASAETVLSLISSFKACPHVNSHFINSPHIFLFEYAVCFLWSPLLNRYTTQVMNEKINTATPRQRTYKPPPEGSLDLCLPIIDISRFVSVYWHHVHISCSTSMSLKTWSNTEKQYLRWGLWYLCLYSVSSLLIYSTDLFLKWKWNHISLIPFSKSMMIRSNHPQLAFVFVIFFH